MLATNHVLNYLEKLGYSIDEAFLRHALLTTIELLMELEISQIIDADHYERNHNRVAYRNGYRKRSWKTPLGSLRLKIPKLRQGTYFPDFITSDTALTIIDLIQNAIVFGIKRSDIDSLSVDLKTDLLNGDDRALFEVYAHISDLVDGYHHQSINTEYACIWLDVVDIDVHRQLALAVGIRGNDEFDLLSFELSSHFNHADFWRDFMRKLSARGLKNVKLVISDAFKGVKSAVYEELPDAEWQFSRAQAVEHILRYVPEYEQDDVRVAISTIFVQPTHESASSQVTQAVGTLRSTSIQSANILSTLHESLIAYTILPTEQQILMETVNTLMRIKQAMLMASTENELLVDAVSSQTILGGIDGLQVAIGGTAIITPTM